MKQRIYYHHTDCGGVVYYANYLEFLEEARTGYLEGRGVNIQELAEKGIMFVVARQEIDYKLPAFYGDLLQIDSRITKVSAVKIEFENDIVNQEGKIISKAKTVMACISKDFLPRAIPAEIKKKLLS